MNDLKLKALLMKCAYETDRDFEGDDTFRLHYKTAQKLIKAAWELGAEETKEMILFPELKNQRGGNDVRFTCLKCGKKERLENEA